MARRRRDIYGTADGPLMTAPTYEKMVETFKIVYPNGYVEGSTLAIFSLMNDREPVGSAWERKDGSYNFRIRPKKPVDA